KKTRAPTGEQHFGWGEPIRPPARGRGLMGGASPERRTERGPRARDGLPKGKPSLATRRRLGHRPASNTSAGASPSGPPRSATPAARGAACAAAWGAAQLAGRELTEAEREAPDGPGVQAARPRLAQPERAAHLLEALAVEVVAADDLVFGGQIGRAHV